MDLFRGQFVVLTDDVGRGRQKITTEVVEVTTSLAGIPNYRLMSLTPMPNGRPYGYLLDPPAVDEAVDLIDLHLETERERTMRLVLEQQRERRPARTMGFAECDAGSHLIPDGDTHCACGVVTRELPEDESAPTPIEEFRDRFDRDGHRRAGSAGSVAGPE